MKASPRPDTGDPVIDAVIGTGKRIRETTNAELQRCGLSLWTFKALRTLDSLGPSRSVDLSDALCIAPRTVTGAVDVLEAEGLVDRTPHPTDRRAHLLVVTDSGRERLAEALTVYRRHLDRGTVALGDDERAQLLALVERLDAAFVDLPAEPVPDPAERITAV